MTATPKTVVRRVFSRSTWPNVQTVTDILRRETVGGALLIAAAILALFWANSPGHESYFALRDIKVGPESLHLDLSLGKWAADGLLAIFFFVAGLELKRELRVGDLSDPAKAAVPIVAAVGGVVAPALIFMAVAATSSSGEAMQGWAIPTATDIAFALAVLAVTGSFLPNALRSFLLTLAVVDDLIAITIIAVFYTTDLAPIALLYALIPLVAFSAIARMRPGWWRWLMLPLALLSWFFVHESGVHATVAGVLLGLSIPIARKDGKEDTTDLAHRLEHLVHPFSAGVAVPIFAFSSAGIRFIDSEPFWYDIAALAVLAGLLLGKFVGVFGGTWLTAKFTHAQLDDDLAWADVAGLALLSGIGFTVSLLISDLAFGFGSPHDDHVKIAVLLGSCVAAVLASFILRHRNKVYRDICRREAVDRDGDGIPDAYQEPAPAPAASGVSNSTSPQQG